MRSVLVVLGVAVLTLAGCGGSGNEGGFGVPRQPADSPLAGPRTDVRGTVRIESDGCMTLDTGTGAPRWIVWPADQEDDQGQPVLDGRLVGDGDELAGTGAELPADALPDWADADSYFRSFGGFCSVERIGIVVLDEVTRG